MATEIIMPKNGMDMTEGVLIRWLKNVGDKVEYEEPIMEIETDKVTMESEAPASGVLLAKYAKEGETVPVLTVIGYIGEQGEKVPEDPRKSGATAAGPKDAPAAQAKKQERSHEYDVAVIGGGPAGYVAAIRAAQLGGKAVIFEKDVVGGTCLNRGCIPTKTYLKTAEYIRTIERAGERGIKLTAKPEVDMGEVKGYKDKVVKTLTGGVAALLKSNGVETVYGCAALSGKNEVTCGDKRYTADSIILCGGSKAGLIPIPGIEHTGVLNSDGILELTEKPDKLCIIGGGVIGCEMACAFRAFGSEVTIVEMLDRLVANMDEEISKAMLKSMKSSGVKVMLGVKVQGIEDESGAPVVVTDAGRVECTKVLLSIGRSADLTCLGSLKDEIKTERNKVIVGDDMRTSMPNIYACGDINGRLMLAHAAFKMAETAAANAMGGNESCSLKYTPSCIYTMPEAAGVGMTEEAARQSAGENLAVGKFPMSANGRSLASGEKQGFVKVLVDKRFGEILGVHIVGADAAEMIAEPASLMSMEVTANEVADGIIHAHPSYSEAFMEACADALGRAVHLPKK